MTRYFLYNDTTFKLVSVVHDPGAINEQRCYRLNEVSWEFELLDTFYEEECPFFENEHGQLCTAKAGVLDIIGALSDDALISAYMKADVPVQNVPDIDHVIGEDKGPDQWVLDVYGDAL